MGESDKEYVGLLLHKSLKLALPEYFTCALTYTMYMYMYEVENQLTIPITKKPCRQISDDRESIVTCISNWIQHNLRDASLSFILISIIWHLWQKLYI